MRHCSWGGPDRHRSGRQSDPSRTRDQSVPTRPTRGGRRSPIVRQSASSEEPPPPGWTPALPQHGHCRYFAFPSFLCMPLVRSRWGSHPTMGLFGLEGRGKPKSWGRRRGRADSHPLPVFRRGGLRGVQHKIPPRGPLPAMKGANVHGEFTPTPEPGCVVWVGKGERGSWELWSVARWN